MLKVSRLLEKLNAYYIYSGYYYARQEIEDNAPDVVQAMTDAFIEAVLWSKANQAQTISTLMRIPPTVGSIPI